MTAYFLQSSFCAKILAMSDKKRAVCDNSHEHLSAFPEVLQEVLCERGLCGTKESEEFLNPRYETLHDPFLFNDMHKATERIISAIEKDEKIMIYSDFDADGIPGGIILKELFDKLGFKNFSNYIPHRNKEGYGLHTKVVESFANEGGSVLITVDLGISATDAARRAKELGVDLIITDHHEALSRPDAFAILNPKLEGEKYPFKELCGASVAWKLAYALIVKAKERKMQAALSIKDGWEKWLLSLAAFSTVADMVPLYGENRVIVHFGLQALQKSPRPGLRAFLRDFGISQAHLDESDIAYGIAPKINAASRLGDPKVAFSLLAETDPLQIQKDITELKRLSELRKRESAKISKEARARLKARDSLPKVFVTGDKSWNPSLLGLAAGKLADEFSLVVCLWGQDESGVFKGSCRNSGLGHIALLLEASKDKLIDFGGHEGAGGFSLNFESLLGFEETLNEAYAKLDFKENEQKEVSYSLKSHDLSWTFFKHLRRLAPFGIGNPAPLFLFNNIEILSKRRFGRHKEHLELIFKSRFSEKSAKAIAFFAQEEYFDMDIKKIYGYVEKSSFRGLLDLRIHIEELL